MCERVADRYNRDYYKESPKVDPAGPGLKKKSLTEYVIDVPKAGEYALHAKVVTANYGQRLIVSANGTDKTMIMPFTCGKWQDSKPVTITLKQGPNTLNFYRLTPPQYGMAVKSYTLKPLQ